MGVRVYYYMVAAVLGFGVLLPQHGRQKNGKFAFHRFSSSKFVTYCKLKWKLRTTQTLWYNGFTTKHISPKKEGSHDEIIPYLVSKMQQKSFILSLRQRFRWLPKVSLPKLLPSICTRTTEVGGGKLSAEVSALPCVRKNQFPTSRLWALFQLPL